jgi:hypothetical protein
MRDNLRNAAGVTAAGARLMPRDRVTKMPPTEARSGASSPVSLMCVSARAELISPQRRRPAERAQCMYELRAVHRALAEPARCRR